MNDDQHLHEAFQASRAAERADAPPFRRVMTGRAPAGRRSMIPALLVIGGAITVVVATIVLRSGPDPAQDLELARQVMAWRSPTDFLLPATVPGLLSTVPRIGEAPAGSPFQALDPGNVLGPPVLPRSPRS